MRRPNPILALLAMLAFAASGHPSSFEPAVAPAEKQTKWPTRTIQISISNSLTALATGIRPGSDVDGALRRALASWASAADVTFIEADSNLQSISPAGEGDGISLITIAPTPDNLAVVSEGNATARTRVFYDSETGAINEADIVLNPYVYGPDGQPLEFSTDGTPGTYDLESTLTHEIGHLLGLTHSSVIASTMQSSQGLNGTYGLAALTERSLSEVDRVAIRNIYGPCGKQGSVKGRILNSVDGRLVPVQAAHVWLEDLQTGRVVASELTNSSGTFRIGCVEPGNYRAMIEYLDVPAADPFALTGPGNGRAGMGRRAFRSVEINSQLRIDSEKPAQLGYVFVSPQNTQPLVNPRFLGANGELSTVPVPVTAGSRVTVYVAGEGVDRIPGSGLLVSSPFISVDAGSLTAQRFIGATPVISFDVIIGVNAPTGDYSLRFQSYSGEVAFLAGGLTVQP